MRNTRPGHRTAAPAGPDGATPQPSSTRAEAIAAAIRKAVIEHRVPPGTRLSEDQIGLIFGASRTIVRAALQALAHDHIVSLAKNRGASVASPTVADARHLFDARRTIEGVIVRRAAARMTPDHRLALVDLIDQGERALSAADRGVAIGLSGDFHLRVASIADQPVLLTFLGELISRSSLVIALYGRGRSADCGVAEHRDLLRALALRDADRAAALMQHHLDHIEASLDLTDPAPRSATLVDAFFTHAISA